jgi:hypothetical protein
LKTAIPWLAMAWILFASGSAHAAKCKFSEDSVDKFTKVRTLSTRWDPLESFFGGLGKSPKTSLTSYVSARYAADSIYLAVRIGLSSYSKSRPPKYELQDAIVVPEGARLLAMMADESVVVLFSAHEVKVNSTAIPPETGSNITSEFAIDTEAVIRYVLDADTMKALTSQGATNLRVEAADTKYDIKVHKKSFGDLKKAIECIQEAL